MEKMTLKKHAIFTVSTLTKYDELRDNKVIVVTSAGVFTGRLMKENSNKDGKALILDVIERTKEELVETGQVPNDGYITLEDATLDTNGTKYNFGNIIIFHDQIVGITLGNTEV